MDENNSKGMLNSKFTDKMRSEMLATMDRGYKTSVQKVTFVTAMLGIGNIQFMGEIDLYHIFYLTPLIAMFFEFAELLQKYSVRRMGVFLKINSLDKVEQNWEHFVCAHRDKIFHIGAIGFTSVVYIVSIWQLHLRHKLDTEFVLLWFLSLLLFYSYVRYKGKLQFDKLEEDSKYHVGDNGDTELIYTDTPNKTN